MPSWDEIRGKIKDAHGEIETAYQKHVVSAIDKVKERPLLNTAVKTALPLIPIIGPTLSAIYDNMGGGTKSEEDKAKQILDFLSELEQKNKEQFDRIAQNLDTNHQVIIDGINENRIAITDLISKSSAEIHEILGSVKEDARETRAGVERIEKFLEERHATIPELKRPPKPSTFRGESKIFVGRKQDIDTVKKYFVESKNLPVSITGEGGIGKSELAYKAMRKCEDMFDLIIPVYFESILTFESFLSEMAKSLNLPIDEFEKKGMEERRQLLIDTLGQGEFKHPLIYADNYEMIARALKIENSSQSLSTKKDEDNARKINALLENIPPNTAVLLTSRERYNLDGERPVRLGGLSEIEGRDLFIELSRNRFGKGGPSEDIKRALDELSKKTGGHPLSIELLARSYRGQGLPNIREMLEHMGVGVVNPKEEIGRLQSLESCFGYSFNKLSQTPRDLLPKLTIFNSPFPSDAVEKIFGLQDGSEILLDLYEHSLLRRIDFEEYAGDSSDRLDTRYYLYYFHPTIRNYLDSKVTGGANRQELENEHTDQFSRYYFQLAEETYNAIGTKEHVLSLERFNVIWQGKDNDFEKAIKLAKGTSVASFIFRFVGLTLHKLGSYEASLEYHKKSLAIHEELKDRVGMAADYNNAGIVLREQGDYDQALRYHEKALTLDEELKDRVGMAADYTNIGIVLQEQGDNLQALDYINKALAIHEELKDRVGMAADYTNIGIVLRQRREYDEALQYHKKSLAIHEELKDRVGMAADYSSIGSVLNEQVQFDEALTYYKKSLAIHEELKDRVGMAREYSNIGIVLSRPGKYDQALTYYKKSLAIHEELKDRVGMARNYINIGNVFADIRYRRSEAIESLSKGLEILEELEGKTGYHNPSTDSLRRYISRLQVERKEAGY